MTVNEALCEITAISQNEDDNNENFMASLDYIDNIYRVLTALRSTIPGDDLKFLPTFTGMYIAERLGVPVTADENSLRYFRVASPLFLEDGILDELKSNLESTMIECDVRREDETVIGITLK